MLTFLFGREPESFNNKRRYDERRNGKQRIKRHSSPNNHSKPRILAELEVTVEDTVERVAEDVAAKLFEQKDHLISKYIVFSCL